MYKTLAEISENNAYIEATIEKTIEALGHPDLPGFHPGIEPFRALLEDCVIANIGSNGQIETPSTIHPTSDRLVITTIDKGEVPLLSPSLNIQTDRQKQRTLDTFKRWKAKPSSRNVLMDLIGVRYDSEQPPLEFPLPRLSQAITGTFVAVYDNSKQTMRKRLPSSPKCGITLVKKTPNCCTYKTAW